MQAIQVTIDRSIPANDWLRVANKRARAAAESAGIEWEAAEVFVQLPEAGRCFTKQAGGQGLIAHG